MNKNLWAAAVHGGTYSAQAERAVAKSPETDSGHHPAFL